MPETTFFREQSDVALAMLRRSKLDTVSETQLLTIRDLMRLTGESESAWRKRLCRHELPYIRLGANVRVRRADLDMWLAERTVPRRGQAS
jgi:excisionase family DNA binding protein